MKIPYPDEPLFTEIYGRTALRPDQPIVDRPAIMAIVEHWVTHEYLLLKRTRGGYALITGGTDDEEIDVAAAREIRAETGYQRMLFLRKLELVHDAFHHDVRRQNQCSHLWVVHLMVIDDGYSPISPAELALHTPRWANYRRVADLLTVSSHRSAWLRFFNGRFSSRA